ncbi:hypothetical protein BJX63DRAFT_379743 [Aspergillus granulosus]|uniref:Uncharacterized protein n=1 Tax=Aspergillus granulosus TaxID=176169 RepID=A0ABR4HZ16_9EURO
MFILLVSETNQINYDRCVRCLIGDLGFIPPICLKRGMSALVHQCRRYHQKTATVIFGSRVSNLSAHLSKQR